jgi:hypothetical protein
MYCLFYKSILKVRKIIETEYNFGKDLACSCAIASSYLFKELEDKGLNPIICVKRGGKLKVHHVYIYCNEYVIDATASQFNRNKIFIKYRTELLKLGNLNLTVLTPKQLNEFNWWVMPTEIFDNVGDLITYQYETGWPVYQIVEEKEIKL